MKYYSLSLVIIATLAACTSRNPIDQPSIDLEKSPEVQVRLHVIGRLIGPDDTFGGAQNPRKLHIVAPSLPTNIKDAIAYVAKRDANLRVKWIQSYDAVEVNSYGEPLGGGAFITLNQLVSTMGRYSLAASITFSKWGEAGGGSTYVYEKQEGKWVLLQRHSSWIS